MIYQLNIFDAFFLLVNKCKAKFCLKKVANVMGRTDVQKGL